MIRLQDSLALIPIVSRETLTHLGDDTTSWGNFCLFLTHYSNAMPI
jgi:hypothetical protein